MAGDDGEAMVEPGKVATSHVLDLLESLQAGIWDVCRYSYMLYVSVKIMDVVYSSITYCCLEIKAC